MIDDIVSLLFIISKNVISVIGASVNVLNFYFFNLFIILNIFF